MAVTTKDLLDKIKALDHRSEKRSIAEIAKVYIGQKVAVLCNRYQYRGILIDVVSDYIILANARFVDISGFCKSEEADREDDIKGPVIISLKAIEIIYQPNWVKFPLTDEEETFELLKNSL